jgi:hypothetical protein
MRVPQVTDRLKEAPAQALRAVFSGVGSVLLVADRLRHRPGQETGQDNGHATRPATAPEGTSSAATAPARYGGSAAQGGPAAKAASPAKASSVKARSAAPPAPRTPPAPPTSANSPAPARSGGRPAKATSPAPAKSGSGTAAGGSGSVTAALDGAVSESGAAGGLPMAGYDGLTVPQLRARMRTLEPAQLRALIAHERAHAGRDEVVAMFERRLAKVEGGG